MSPSGGRWRTGARLTLVSVARPVTGHIFTHIAPWETQSGAGVTILLKFSFWLLLEAIE